LTTHLSGDESFISITIKFSALIHPNHAAKKPLPVSRNGLFECLKNVRYEHDAEKRETV